MTIDPEPWLALTAGEGVRRLTLNGRQTLEISGRDTIFLVLSGTVNLFTTPYRREGLTGRRRSLCAINAGGLFLGMPPIPGEGGKVGIIAAGGLNVEVLEIAHRNFLETLPVAEVADRLDRWIITLARGQNDTVLTYSDHPSSLEGIVRLKPGVRMVGSSHGVGWFPLQGEKTAFLDQPVEEGHVPLCADTWLEILGDTPVERVTRSTADLLEEGALWPNLAAFHTLVTIRLGGLLVQHGQRDSRNLERRWRGEERSLTDGFAALAGTVRPLKKDQISTRVDPEQALLAACRLVAEPLGHVVSAPPERERPDLDEILGASGLRSRTVLLRDEWWLRDNGPLLGTRNDEVPVALLPVRGGGGYVQVDPISGQRLPVDRKIAQSLGGQAVSLYRRLPDFPVSFRQLVAFGLHDSRTDLFRIPLLGLAVALLGIVTPIATGILIESVIPRAALSQHEQLVAILAAAAFGAAGFEAVKSFAILRVEGRLDWSLQAGVFDRLLRLPSGFFRSFTSGDLADRTLGIQTIRETLSGTIIVSMFSFLFSFISLVVMFFYSWQLALIGLGVVLVFLVVTAFLARAQMRHEREYVRHQGGVEGLVLQFIIGVSKLHVAGAHPRAMGTWARLYQKQKGRFVAARALASVQEFFQATVPLGANLLVFMGVIWLLKDSAHDVRLFALTGSGPDLTGNADPAPEVFSVGSLLAFNAAFGQFLQSMTGMTLALSQALGVRPLFERFHPIIEAVPENGGGRRAPGRLRGGMIFNGVSFRYSSQGPTILDDFSLAIKPGEFIAIVGPSGSGKSTLLRLILGFESPQQGEIYFDRKPLRGLDLDAVRRQMGVVLQNGRIAAGSIFSNIAGSRRISQEQAMRAARRVGLAEDIAAMPMGLHTVLQEGGGSLSGGQRQRLLLARALAGRPAILLLDEATSALDNQTQATVMEGVKSLDITRVVIAHRLSTIVHADRILVMQDGRVVESGDYETLMAKNRIFAGLVQRQLL
ncbi:MAG: NHLP bacteriocin export ABC transporter permease/ATPase subunit [Magnetococcales bacterium]|nr:NHLP bacteriocin export ABC transporter permease/ATPase subunit [Magnetococcales bacterium]